MKTASITPLTYSARYGHLNVVKFLIEDMKCDPNEASTNGKIPLIAANKGGHMDVIIYVTAIHCTEMAVV